MDFLQNFIQLDPINNTVKVLLLIFLLSLILIVIGFYLDFLKNKQNEKKLNILERAIKDLIEEFRTIELSLSDQKKILNNYKYTLERLDQEISRLADSSEGDSNITNAIKMANQGKSVDEISQTTGMTKEEIEPIIKYHGRTWNYILKTCLLHWIFWIWFLKLTFSFDVFFSILIDINGSSRSIIIRLSLFSLICNL